MKEMDVDSSFSTAECSRGNVIYRLIFIKYLKQRPPTSSQHVTCFMKDVSSNFMWGLYVILYGVTFG